MSRDKRGWEIDDYSLQDTSSANCQTRGSYVDLDFGESGLVVVIDEGTGYMAQSCSATIPIDVLVELLTRVGFTVNAPPRKE
jgi:hypothetical protein